MKRLISLCTLLLLILSSCDSVSDFNDKSGSSLQTPNIAADIPPGTPPAKADSIRKAAWQQFRAQNGPNWNIRWSKQTGLPVSIFGGLTEKTYHGNPQAAARAFLADHPSLFGFAQKIEYVETQRHRGVSSVTFRQYYQGIPVEGGQFNVHIRSNGKIDMVNGDFYPKIEVSTSPSVAASAAISTAKRDLGLTNPQQENNNAELYILPEEKGSFALIYKVSIRSKKPFKSWLYYIDAHSGEVLRKLNRVTRVTGSGKVYPVSPCESSVTTDDLYRLNGTGYLDGTYAKVWNEVASRAYSATNTFNYATSNTHFDEVSIYYHIDTFRSSFIEDLDAGNNLFAKIDAYAHHNGSICPSNACFYGGNLYFTSSPYAFARENKVVYHEYGHAVINDIESGIASWDNEEGAISEGTPDYWAGSFTGDATINDCAAPFYMRDMVNPAYDDYDNIPKNPNTGEIDVDSHIGGEFFSSILWNLRAEIGAGTVDFLVYDALNRVTDTPDFLEFRDAMLAADAAAYNGQHYDPIRNTFASRGVGSFVPPSVGINGETAMIEGSSGTYTATVSGGFPPYIYQWYYKDDQSDSWTAVRGSNSSTYSHTALQPSQDYLRVLVTDSKSSDVYAYKQVLVIGFN